MTAKERRERDPLVELLDNAPEDDEPTTPEEEDGVFTARARRTSSGSSSP
jgi:hypothetical protein